VALKSGPALKPKGLQIIPEGDRVIVEMPGGGGMGAATERAPAAVKRDVRLGYLTEEAARRDYGLAE
jgi:N-methylhydantoinase B